MTPALFSLHLSSMKSILLGGAVTGVLSLLPAQTKWTQVTPPTTPGARSDHAMCYIPTRQRVVSFGGWDGNVGLSDTWEFDGRTWQDVSPMPSQPIRSSHRMVYDSARDVVVCFGGWDGSATMRDTLEWDGKTWTTVTTATTPPARMSYGMAYDASRSRAVMFGGWTGSQRLGDTWEYDGRTWTQTTTVTAPAARFTTGMAYDPIGKRVLLFSGRTSTGRPADTWAYDGTWKQLSPTSSPSGRTTVMSFDSARNRAVVYGGFDGRAWNNDVWEFDGTGWQRRSTSARPMAQAFTALAYDSTRGHTVLFGGENNGRVLGQQWEYGPVTPASFESFGKGCGKASIDFTRSNRPWLGETFVVSTLGARSQAALVIGLSNTGSGGVRLPIDLGPKGMPGCFMRVSPEVMLSLLVRTGRAEFWIPIPNSASLLGSTAYVQGYADDPAANALGFMSTDGGTLVIGGK